jgi:hypothetical protein
MLRQALGNLKYLEQEITDLQVEIAQRMQAYETQIRHLVTIPGVDRIVAWTIIAELGPDMGVFPDARHAASWVGICPGNHESAGKQMSGRTRKANSYLRRDLCQAAWAASHTKGTYLAALYRRFTVRHGHNKAIMAVAHQILVVAYQMLLKGEDYKEQGGNYFDIQNRPKVASRLMNRLTSLGYRVILEPALAFGSPPLVAEEATHVPSELPIKQEKRRPGRPCKCASRGISCPHKSHSSVTTRNPSGGSIPST